MFGNDYFTKRMGYVIDSKSLGGHEKAQRYLMDTCGMEEEEAESYLRRIYRDYKQRCRAAAAQNAAFGDV